MNDTTKWAVVTGASAGLGVEFARQLAAKGYAVALVARRRDRLEALAAQIAASAKVEAIAIEADLATREGPRALIDALAARSIVPDVLVNNAGFGMHGLAVDMPVPRALEMIDLNVRALTELSLALGAQMAARGRGAIVNVASTAAFQPDPFFAAYGATKAYVHSFTQALAHELAKRGVHVMGCYPGPTATEFFEAGGVNAHLSDALIMTAERCVRITLRGLERRRRMVVTGFLNKLSAIFSRWSPEWLVVIVSAWLMRPKLPAKG